MSPPGDEHGLITMHVAGPLYAYVNQHNLGVVYAARLVLSLNRIPTQSERLMWLSSAVSARRIGRSRLLDWARICRRSLESPRQRTEVNQKVAGWLEAGAQMVG